MIGRRREKLGRATERDIASALPTGDHPFTIARHGYDVTEVAAFVSSLSTEMTTLAPADLRRIEFSVARRGYDKAEVNAYLTRIAAEVEADLDAARAAARIERLTNLDPALADPGPEDPAASALPRRAPQPIPEVDVSPPPIAEPIADVVVFEAPTHNGPGEPVATPTDVSGREVLWISADEFEAGAPAPRPAPPEPEPASQPRPEPAPTVADASAEIGDLLRAAHDTALRLRSQAEADVRSTIDAAKAEIDERTKTQKRELAEGKAAAERQHAEVIHHAELSAIGTRNAADRDAAAMRAAAAAVMTQARAEVEAVKALARHNLGEIDSARQMSLAQARQMLALGRGMLGSVVDLDRECEQRLAHSKALIEAARGVGS